MFSVRRHNQTTRVILYSLAGLLVLASVLRVAGLPGAARGVGKGAVVISELMAGPNSPVVDERGRATDWFELHNRGDRPVSLLGWSATDDPAAPDKWPLPDISIAPGEYLLVYASGEPRSEGAAASEQPGILHANFKLNSTGGLLALYDNTSRRFIDASSVNYAAQLVGKSYGLCDEGRAYCYLDTPSPGAANAGAANRGATAWTGMTAPVTAQPGRGFYEAPVQVRLTTETHGATIRYTLDGSEPTESTGLVYEGPLDVSTTAVLRAAAFKPDYLASASTTHTYIFPADVVKQGAAPEGMPATWGAYRIDKAGHKAGEPVIGDYEMDPEVVDNPVYGPMLRDNLLNLPTISLVTDVSNLDIYFEDPQARGPEAERAVSVEWISPDGSEPGFQINAGLRLQGGVGRWEHIPKHPMRLFFRQEYGPGRLVYPLFPGSPVESFDTLILRAGATYSFVGELTPELTTYGRDEWLRRSQLETFGVASHGRFAHLYINGLYWGLYNVVERPDGEFASSYLGGDLEDWYSGNHGGTVSGPIDRFQVLRDLTSQGNLSDPQKYATMLEFIDPVQFIDYLLANWYAGNEDWPETNWFVNVQYPAGQNLFFVWDGETTWSHGAVIRLGPDDNFHTFFPNIIKPIFLALMENADFRMTLADRFFKLTMEGGALSDAEALARWNQVMSEVERGIVAESARWGDVRREPPIVLEDWYVAKGLVAEQMNGNAARLIGQARELGYYPPFDPPTFSAAAGEFTDQLALAMDAPAGLIYYTTDGTDPRAPVTGEVAAGAQRYASPLTLTTTTRVKARVLVDGVWSALHEADYLEAGEPTGVRITELMYHPTDGEQFEFIELTNVGGIDIDLASAYFEGVNLQFDRYVRLPARSSIVIVADFHAYRERYPDAPVRAVYAGSLSNTGETITLYAPDGSVLASVTYDDEAGWPLTADGYGDSIELISATGDPNRPANWRASSDLLGTPGRTQLLDMNP